MHFTVIGAGAIGGALTAHLMRGGQDVLLVEQNPERVAAIRQRGLTLSGKEAFGVQPRVIAPGEIAAALAARAPEAILLAVKSQHTATALAPILPLLTPASFVVSMQNGLNPHVVAAAVGIGRSVGTLLNTMGASSVVSGEVVFTGPGNVCLGELRGGDSARLRALAALLRRGFAARVAVTDNIWGFLWAKEAYSTMFFLSAVADTPMTVVTSDPDNLALLADLAAEVLLVAEREGVRPVGFDGFEPDAMRFAPGRDWAAIRGSWLAISRVTARSSKPKSGIWIDLAVRHCRTEVDDMIGRVAEIAAARGTPAPLLGRLIGMVHEIERGERAMGPGNLLALRALDAATYPAATPARGPAPMPGS